MSPVCKLEHSTVWELHQHQQVVRISTEHWWVHLGGVHDQRLISEEGAQKTPSWGIQPHISRSKVDMRKMPCVWRALGKGIYFKKEYCLQGVLMGFRGNVNFFFSGWNSYYKFLMVNHSFLNFYIKHFILLYWLNFYALLHFDSKEWPGNTLWKLETICSCSLLRKVNNRVPSRNFKGITQQKLLCLKKTRSFYHGRHTDMFALIKCHISAFNLLSTSY